MVDMLKEWHWLNGRFVNKEDLYIPARLLGLLRGWAIFEYFLSVEDGLSPLTDLYLNRFYQSAKKLRLEVPIDKLELKDLLKELVHLNGGIQAFRLVLSAGESADGWNPDEPPVLLIFSESVKEIPMHWLERGIKIKTYEFLRPLPEIKTTFYAIGKLAQMDSDADDVLFTYDGKVLETPRSNIFFVKGDTLVTAGSNVLKGITRKIVIDIAQEMGIEVIERNVSTREVSNMDGAFITGTTKPIVPVSMIDNTRYDLSVTKHLLETLRKKLLERSGMRLQTVVKNVLND